MPYIIWWPLKPDHEYLRLLAENVPEMKRQVLAAAIACDYVGLYKWLDPEPSWHLWIVAAEFSPNPFYREDQERRAREKGVQVEHDNTMALEYSELMQTRETTVFEEGAERIPDSVEKQELRSNMYETVEVFSTSFVQLKIWEGIEKMSPE
jgi:hypothetical protein